MRRGRKPKALKTLIQQAREKILADDEISALPFEGLDVFSAYSQGVMLGLLDRLERIDQKEADAAAGAIHHASSRFGELLGWERLEGKSREEKLAIAKLTLQIFIGGIHPRLTASRKRVLLLLEYEEVMATIRRLTDDEKKAWLVSHERMKDKQAEKLADRFPHEIAKEVVARRHKRHNMTASQVQREVTRAHKDIEKGEIP